MHRAFRSKDASFFYGLEIINSKKQKRNDEYWHKTELNRFTSEVSHCIIKTESEFNKWN